MVTAITVAVLVFVGNYQGSIKILDLDSGLSIL